MICVFLRRRLVYSLVVHQDEQVREDVQVQVAGRALGAALLSGLRPAQRVSSLRTNSPLFGGSASRVPSAAASSSVVQTMHIAELLMHPLSRGPE